MLILLAAILAAVYSILTPNLKIVVAPDPILFVVG
jgi:hypothetical protein